MAVQSTLSQADEDSYILHRSIMVPIRCLQVDNYRDVRSASFQGIKANMATRWEFGSTLLVIALHEDKIVTPEWAMAAFKRGDPLRFVVLDGGHRTISAFELQDEGKLPWEYVAPMMIFSMRMPYKMRAAISGRSNNGLSMAVRETTVDRLCWVFRVVRDIMRDDKKMTLKQIT